ncbi:MAG: PH domain-containing protein [Oscillospiraceae bacterium]|nr:PH domain-containing protein [Oscillospiraceae bacterium]
MGKKLVIEQDEILWKDRKRTLFGLPLSFTRYEVCKDRLTVRRGFFKTTTDEIMIYRILDVRLVRGLGQKIFGLGTVTLLSNDKSSPSLELKSIKASEDVRRFLSKLIEDQRASRGVTSREFLGMDGDEDGIAGEIE